MSNKREVRLHSAPGHRVSIRANSNGGNTATGYFATWGTVSHDLGRFREVIAGPEVFAGSLRSQPVRALVDHTPEKLLGRTESGTLQVTADSIGLRFAVDLPKGVSYADDLAILLQRGDAFENSFAFSVDGPDGEAWSEQPDGTWLRTLKRCILYEGSILTGNNAAYPSTVVDLRQCPASLRGKLKTSIGEDDPVLSKKKKRDDFDCDGEMPEDADPDEWEEECSDRRRAKAAIALSLRRLRQTA